MNSIKQGGYIAEKADKIYEVGVVCFFIIAIKVKYGRKNICYAAIYANF